MATHKPIVASSRCGLLAVGLSVLLAACGGPESPAEVQLSQWVERAAAAAEARERRKLVSMISPAYADARGNDRERIERMLLVYFTRMNSVELITSVGEINVIGDSAALVSVTAAGMGGTHDSVLGFRADAYEFALELEREGDDWQLISARWGELGRELR